MVGESNGIVRPGLIVKTFAKLFRKIYVCRTRLVSKTQGLSYMQSVHVSAPDNLIGSIATLRIISAIKMSK